MNRCIDLPIYLSVGLFIGNLTSVLTSAHPFSKSHPNTPALPPSSFVRAGCSRHICIHIYITHSHIHIHTYIYVSASKDDGKDTENTNVVQVVTNSLPLKSARLPAAHVKFLKSQLATKCTVKDVCMAGSKFGEFLREF